METLERFEEQLNFLREAIEAVETVVEELDLQGFEQLEKALAYMKTVQTEIQEVDIPAAQDQSAGEYHSERQEWASTYREQQGF